MAMIGKAVQSPILARITYESPEIIRKRGKNFRLRREVEAMDYVRNHTTIPIPTVFNVQLDPDERSGQSWIRMKRLPGCDLGQAWPSMNETAKAQTISQLKSYFQQLHNLRQPQPGTIVGSCSMGPAYDHRIDNLSTCGPFESIGKFNDFLVAPIKNYPRPGLVTKYRSRLSDSYDIVFAHADLSWEHILVDPGTGNVTGILDWEMAGFWPEWWEYRKALCGARSQLWWMDILEKIMQEYREETEVDDEIEMF